MESTRGEFITELQATIVFPQINSKEAQSVFNNNNLSELELLLIAIDD